MTLALEQPLHKAFSQPITIENSNGSGPAKPDPRWQTDPFYESDHKEFIT